MRAIVPSAASCESREVITFTPVHIRVTRRRGGRALLYICTRRAATVARARGHLQAIYFEILEMERGVAEIDLGLRVGELATHTAGHIPIVRG